MSEEDAPGEDGATSAPSEGQKSPSGDADAGRKETSEGADSGSEEPEEGDRPQRSSDEDGDGDGEGKRRRPATWIGLLVVALVAALTWFFVDVRGPASSGDGPGEGGGSTVDGQEGPSARVQGVVLREVALDADAADPGTTDTGTTDTGGGDDTDTGGDEGSTGGGDEATDADTDTGAEVEPADDPMAELLAELPPFELRPPEPGSCRVRAWQGGKPVGALVPCDDEGGYRLEIEAGVGGTIHVELLVEGHLRGLIPAELPDPLIEAVTVDMPTVALGPAVRVTGQTVDARGEPIADVRVQALPRPNLDEPEPWRTRSDEQGRFDFTTLPFGPVSLRAIKDGYALSVVEAIAPEDEVLMVLDALHNLEGGVVGDPELLARAKVRLEGSSVWPAIEQGLSEDGSFVFERLPDGIYGLEVQVPPAEPGGQEYASVPLENVTPDLRVNLALVPAFRIPTRVVDPEGEPVPQARVTLGYGDLGMLQKVSEANEEGRVRAGPVVPGPYVLRADADGFLPAAPVDVEVGQDGFAGKEQVLVLARPAKIEGVVVDENDRPVPGAEVMLESEVAFAVGEGDTRARMFAVAIGASEGSLGVTRGEVPDIPLFPEDEQEQALGGVLADEHGRFEIPMLLPGKHRVWAIHGGHAASAVQVFELQSGELRTGVRLQLREGVPLTGVVRTSNGQPIANVQVDLGDGLILSTDERGVFDAGYRRGQQRLILRAPGMIPVVVEPRLGKLPVDLELELEPAEAEFEGRVVDGNNQPVADVEVELRPLDGLSPSVVTWTDDKGVYRFDELPPGPVELRFEHGDYVPAEIRARAGDDPGTPPHELVLETGWEIDVLVRSAGRGDPIPEAKLVVGKINDALTDDDGRAMLQRLIDDRVELEVSAPGWIAQTFVLRDDGTGRVELTVELVEGGAIEGTIDDDIGEPVNAAKIEVRSPGGDLLGEAQSNGRGEWRVEGVPEGDVVVRATPPAALSALLAPTSLDSDVLRGEVTKAVRLRFDRL